MTRSTDTLSAEIGVIGGTGFYEMDGLSDISRIQIDTPFGSPSSLITIGTVHRRRVAFISRHNEGHQILPSEIPSHANIYALKKIGVRQILTVSAVGSLREELSPRHAVVPDQLIDRTHGRSSTFFGNGAVAHVGFADPFDPTLCEALASGAETAGITTHRGGTLIVMEGPAFSTRAESSLNRNSGASIIGMTALPEANLAREAEHCYASLCLNTDYDVWHISEIPVSVEMVIRTLIQNTVIAQNALLNLANDLPASKVLNCGCSDALADAIITQDDSIPDETKKHLGLLIDKYL